MWCFFLQSVFDIAQWAFRTAQQLIALFEQDRGRVGTLQRGAGSALQVLQYAQRKMVFSVPEADEALGISPPTIRKAVEGLETLGILDEVTGKGRNRVWVYREYLRILGEGTEPL